MNNLGQWVFIESNDRYLHSNTLGRAYYQLYIPANDETFIPISVLEEGLNKLRSRFGDGPIYFNYEYYHPDMLFSIAESGGDVPLTQIDVYLNDRGSAEYGVIVRTIDPGY